MPSRTVLPALGALLLLAYHLLTGASVAPGGAATAHRALAGADSGVQGSAPEVRSLGYAPSLMRRGANPTYETESASAKPDTAANMRVSQSYGRLPLSFEANQGQTDPQVKFLARGPGYTVYLTATEAVLALRQAKAPEDAAASRPVGANSFARMRINSHLPLPEAGPGTRAGEDEFWPLWSLTGEVPLASQSAQHMDASDFLPDLSTPTLPSPWQGEGWGGSEGENSSTAPKTTAVRLKLVGANSAARMEGVEPLPGKVNYLLGNDPKKWRTDVPTYAKVRYQEVYPGIDLVYYGSPRQLEHDFIVMPGADPKAIRLAFEGLPSTPSPPGLIQLAGAGRGEGEKNGSIATIDANGDLVLHANGGDVRLRKPLIYQQDGGKRKEIEGAYVLGRGGGQKAGGGPAGGSLRCRQAAHHRPGAGLLHLPRRERR